MRIGLLYTVLRKEEKLIAKAFEKLGVEVVKIDDKASKMRLGKNDFSGLDCVLVRSISLTHALFWSSFFESLRIKTVNTYDALNTCGNKYLTALRLRKDGIPTPKDVMAFDSSSAMELMEELGFPCVLKPVTGSWGRMISKINDREAAQAILEHRPFLNTPYKSAYYIQEYISKPGRDIRTLVVGEKVAGAVYRTSSDWKTNTALGAVAAKCPVTDDIRDLSLKAARAVGGDIVSIDIFESGKSLLVNEVNGVTEFGKSLEAYGVDIPKEIAKHTVKVASAV